MATRMLQRSLYAGYITIPSWGFQMHPGKHEALISLTLWQDAQNKLQGKRLRPARADIHEDFPLRNFVACEGCKRPMTAGWSKGKTKHYAYYTCQTKSCDFYGKSIGKEKVETAFGELVHQIAPRPALINTVTAMFRDAWDMRIAQADAAKDHLRSKLAELDRKRSKLMKRLVTAPCDDVVSAYEQEITNIVHEKRLLEERCEGTLEPHKSFDECFDAAMKFFARPWKLWESGVFAQQRLLLKLSLPEPIVYSRENGFLNTNFSLPFKLLGDKNMQKMQMVRPRRLELPPVLPDSDLNAARLPIPPRPHIVARK